MRLTAACALSLVAITTLDGPSVAAPPQLEDGWRRCTDRDADIGISGCTEVIRSSREIGANRAAAFYNRGIAYYRKSQHDRAIDAGDPRNGEHPLDRAIQDYGEAIRLKPNYPEAFVNRGIAFYDKGQYDLAIQDYDWAIRLKPDLAEAFNNRSLAYYRKGQYDRAKQDFDQTIRLNKNYGNALINRSLGPSETQAGQRSR